MRNTRFFGIFRLGLPPFFSLALVTAGLVAATGCVSVGENLSEKAQSQIQVGDPQSKVEKILGKPSEIVEGDGRVLFLYFGTRARLYEEGFNSIGVRMNSFNVLMNEQGIVIKTHSYQGRTLVQGALVSSKPRIGVALNEETVQQLVVEGETSLQQMNEWFGEPWYEVLALDETITRIWATMSQKNAFSKVQIFRLVVLFDSTDVVESYTCEQVEEE